jgi:hypothetical protein
MAMCASPDKGKWTTEIYDGKVFLFSDDFTHDVKLQVSGDFGTLENKIAYAKALADWMSERLLDDADDKIPRRCPCTDCYDERTK